MVLSSDPAAGDRVLDGGTVTVVLSLGPERYAVPKVAGSTEDEAQKAIQDANLDFGRSIEKFSEKVPAGELIRSDPTAGTRLKPGTTVDIDLSQRSQTRRVGKKSVSTSRTLW